MADNSGELHVEVSVDIDTSSVQSELEAMVGQIQDQAIDLKVKAATEGAQGELKALQDQIDQLVGHVGILDSQMDNFSWHIQQISQDIRVIESELAKTLRADEFTDMNNSIFGLEDRVKDLSTTVETLQTRMDELGKGGQGFQNVQQTAEHTTQAFQETNKAIQSTQQASSQATNVVVANEKEKQAAIKQTNDAYEQQRNISADSGNWAKNLLNVNLAVEEPEDARNQLEAAYHNYVDVMKDTDEFSEAGTQAGYAYVNALINVIQNCGYEHGAADFLEQYKIPVFEDINFNKFSHLPDSLTALDNYIPDKLNQFTVQLQNFAAIYDQVIQELGTANISDALKQQIEEIVQLQTVIQLNQQDVNDIETVRSKGEATQEDLKLLRQLNWDIKQDSEALGQLTAEFQNSLEAEKELVATSEELGSGLNSGVDATTESLHQEAQATQELIQAEQTHAEVGVAANQQVQNSAETVVEGYKEITSAANEAIEAEKQANNTAQIALDQNYMTSGKKEACERLKSAYENYNAVRNKADENGQIDNTFWATTEEGAKAGYELGQAWAEGVRQGIATSKLEKYAISDWYPEDIEEAIRNPDKFLSGQLEDNTVVQDLKANEQVLRDYSTLYNQIIGELGDIPVPEAFKEAMQNIASLQDTIRKEQDFSSFLEEEPGYQNDSTWQSYQAAIQRQTEELNGWKQCLQDCIDVWKSFDSTAAESSSAAAEGFEKVAEAEEKVASTDLQTTGTPLAGVAETAEEAAKSIDEAAESEEKLVNTDVSGEASALDNISESAKSAEQSIDGAKESLEELSKQPTETTPTPEPPQQQDKNDYQKTKQDISEVVEAYNTLIRTEEEWQRLNAIQPADWTEAEADKLGKLKAQRDAANETIAKATDLTEKEVAAQTKYNKKLSELEATQKNQIEYERQRTEALEARRQAQDEADAAVEAEAAAQIARLQDEVDKNWELAKAEEAALEAYKTLDSLEMKHQQNQQTLNQGGALNVAQNSIEVQYEKAKAVIDATTVSTDKLTAAEERHKAVATEAAEVLARTNEQKAKKEELNQVSELTKAYQTLETAGAKWVDLMNKQAKGNTLNTTQRIELDDLTNSLKVAMAYTQEHAAATDQDTAAAERWERVQQILAKSLNDQVDAINKSNGELKGYASSLEEAKKLTEQLYAAGTNGDPLKWAKDGTAATGMAKFGNEVQKVQYNIVKCGDSLYEVRAAIKTSQEATSAWEKAVSAVANRMKTLGVYLASFVSVYRIFGAIKEGVSTVNELNTQLTEMRKVSDETTNSLKNYQAQTFAVAKEVGSTAATIQASTADYLRLGKSLNEAAELAKNTSILMSVSEFEDVNAATEAMISMTQAFKEMSSMEIIDELNKIGNNFSISTSDLAMGMQTAASTLTVAGNSFEQSLALMTAGNAVIQDYSKTATGLRTISLRIMGTKAAMEELEDMGEDVSDYEVTTTAKMAEIIEALTQVGGKKGVNILTDNGNLRSTYDILLDIAKVWDQIREEDERTGQNRQQALLEQLAGEILPECIEMCA